MPEGEVYVGIESPRGEIGLLHRVGRFAEPVPHAHARCVVHQHPVPAAHDARRSRRRRRGRHLQRRPRPRRSRQMSRLTERESSRSLATSSCDTRGKKSALIPLLHLSQEQNGYVTDDAMRHLAELLDITPAEVIGTATFYEMFKFEPVGTYVINICQTMSCATARSRHVDAPRRGEARHQGRFHHRRTACSRSKPPSVRPPAPRRRHCRSTTGTSTGSRTDDFDQMIDDLRSGALSAEIPPHGTLGRNRQHIPADKFVGAPDPDDVDRGPGMDPKAAWPRTRAQSREQPRAPQSLATTRPASTRATDPRS